MSFMHYPEKLQSRILIKLNDILRENVKSFSGSSFDSSERYPTLTLCSTWHTKKLNILFTKLVQDSTPAERAAQG